MTRVAVVSLLSAGAISLTACNVAPNGQVNVGNDSGATGGGTAAFQEEPAPPAGWKQAEEPRQVAEPWYDPAPVVNCGYSATGIYFCD